MDPVHGLPIVIANEEERDLGIDEKIHNEKGSIIEKDMSSGDVEVVNIDEDGDVIRESDYTPEKYKNLLSKISHYLQPLMWCCYGIQQTYKTSRNPSSL